MTIHFPDISSYQAGFPLDNIPAIFVKATEGTDYVNPDFSRVRADASGRWLLTDLSARLVQGRKDPISSRPTVACADLIG